MWFNGANAIKKLARNLDNCNDMIHMNVITIERVKHYAIIIIIFLVITKISWNQNKKNQLGELGVLDQLLPPPILKLFLYFLTEQALAKLTQDKETLIAKKSIKLPSFSQIDYKLAKGTVFLKTLQLLIAVGCPSKYLDENPSRSYFVLIRLLKKRGMNIKECFLKQGEKSYKS